MSGNRITALIIVALIHIVLGYALVTGLAFEAAKKVIQKVTTVDIKEPEKPKTPPPPPPKPKEAPPPPVAPPVKINVAVTPPQIQTVVTPPPAPPPIVLAPPAPVPPPPPKGPTSEAQPKSSPSTWATNDDYPSRALRAGEQGTTGFSVTIGTDGRVSDCQITSSSGSQELDQTTCSLITRRARFRPAMMDGQPTTGHYSSHVRWVVPKD